MHGKLAAVLAVGLTLACGSTAGAQEQPPAPSRSRDLSRPPAKEALHERIAGEATPVGSHVLPSFLTTLGRDFGHLPSINNNALTVGIGGALALAVWPADSDLTRGAQRFEPVEEAFDAGAALGSGWVQAGGAVGTYVIGRMTSNPRVQALGGDLIGAQVVGGVLTQGLKFAFHRTRPDGASHSFPSGHASAAFASATVLQRYFGWKVGVPVYSAAAYVAASRLSENKHYASDVIFGAAIGIVAGRSATVGRGANNRFAVIPVALPDGVAVTFARVSRP